ncbi:hypothetical protein [Caldilinea sp.]|uniref:hypothetical protein n=1 Tax=Caldilinea sp. TaxID=2293560 RepID=UPI002D0C82ED|nr:hypothetical protein [Anaerolineales bacterium]HQY92726.1 hypothetical protein [Caldilinea sp.]HRA64524.1 hypothetical protein [Caldilinea sp.]
MTKNTPYLAQLFHRRRAGGAARLRLAVLSRLALPARAGAQGAGAPRRPSAWVGVVVVLGVSQSILG